MPLTERRCSRFLPVCLKIGSRLGLGIGVGSVFPSPPIFQALAHLLWLLGDWEHVLWLLSNWSPVFGRPSEAASGLSEGGYDKPQQDWLCHGSVAMRHHPPLERIYSGEGGPFHSMEKAVLVTNDLGKGDSKPQSPERQFQFWLNLHARNLGMSIAFSTPNHIILTTPAHLSFCNILPYLTLPATHPSVSLSRSHYSNSTG